MSGTCGGGWVTDAGGWVQPSGVTEITSADGSVTVVDPAGPVVDLAVNIVAADVPSDGPSTVQADLDALKYIESAADLEARFPAVGGVHTVDQGSEWRLPVGSTEIDIGSNTIAGVYPGGISFVGAQGIIKTDVDATLAVGELAVRNCIFKNVNAGASALCVDLESLFGRRLVLNVWGCVGVHPGRIANVFAIGQYSDVQVLPTAAGATSLEIDGTNGPVLFTTLVVSTPGSVPYTGLRLLATAATASVGVQQSAVAGSVAGDALLYVDPAVTLPPTDTVSVVLCTAFGPADVFDATGLVEDDDVVLALNNVNARSSKWLGDLAYASGGGAPIALTMSGGVEVMPVENAGPTAAAALTASSERFTFPAPTGLQDYELISGGRNDAIQGEVSIDCTVKRSGGTIRQFFCWVQYRTGPDPAVWSTIEESKGERSLNTTYDSVRGSAPFEWDRTYEFRPVVQGIVGTDTDILDWRLQIGQGRP